MRVYDKRKGKKTLVQAKKDIALGLGPQRKEEKSKSDAPTNHPPRAY